MADNVSVSTVGGTETIAADEISSVKYQRVKMIYGPDGTNSGDVRKADATTEGPLPANAYLASDYVMVNGLALTPKFATASISATAETTIVAAVTGKKIRVLAGVVSKVDAGTAQFKSGTAGTALTGPMHIAASTSWTLPFNPLGWFETASATLLSLVFATGTATGGAFVVYVEV